MAASEVFCKDFFNISYENVSCRILESLLWLQLIFFFNWNCILVCELCFWITGDTLTSNTKDFTLYLLHKLVIMENLRHCINQFRLFYNWRIKSSKDFPRRHVVPGLFFKNCSRDEVRSGQKQKEREFHHWILHIGITLRTKF